MTEPGLGLVPPRGLFVESVEFGFELHPGDRVRVAAGEQLDRGAELAHRLRDPRTAIVAGPADASDAGAPGKHWTPAPGRRAHEGAAAATPSPPPCSSPLSASSTTWVRR